MLFRMLLLAVLMIVGFGLAFGGGMILFIGKAEELSMAIGFLVPGLGFGLGGLYFLIKMNKAYQVKALNQALEEPNKILLNIAAIGDQKRILLTEDAFFLGEKHYPFHSAYENLHQIDMEGDVLILDSDVYGGKHTHRRSLRIEIPPHHLETAKAAILKIKEIHQIKS